MANIERIAGIVYKKPAVYLLNETGIGVAELAARTCYDSFENSENDCIRDFDAETLYKMNGSNTEVINNIESSELLSNLAWVHHHHSIIEHSYLQFLIKGTSRGVLQEHARHRLQNISVRSTRYTMQDILYIYIASRYSINARTFFLNEMRKLDMFIVSGFAEDMEIDQIFNKLTLQSDTLGYRVFSETCLSKDAKERFDSLTKFKDAHFILETLRNSKSKRNVGDNFKWIVTDNWKVDLVVTMNLRALKNYYDLRDSGAAYFQIRWLAEEMKKVTPEKYLKLIDKKYKN